MPEPRAQRTLVKSPPEIWSEISDVSTLARHLGEFGEIRITRLEAETTVAWEGDTARGTVELEPSGWGTKVTMTAEAVAAEVEPVVEPEPVAEPEPVVEPEPVAATPAPEPTRRGFLARLLRRRARTEPAAEPVVAVEPEPEAVAVEPEPEPAAVEPAPAPTVADDHIEAVLVSVLDDLGAAHHRPFSRG
jgi:hypothetical protein